MTSQPARSLKEVIFVRSRVSDRPWTAGTPFLILDLVQRHRPPPTPKFLRCSLQWIPWHIQLKISFQHFIGFKVSRSPAFKIDTVLSELHANKNKSWLSRLAPEKGQEVMSFPSGKAAPQSGRFSNIVGKSLYVGQCMQSQQPSVAPTICLILLLGRAGSSIKNPKFS